MTELLEIKAGLENVANILSKIVPFLQNVDKRLERIENDMQLGDLSEIKKTVLSIKSDLSSDYHIARPSISASSDHDQSSQSNQSELASNCEEGQLLEDPDHGYPGHSGLLLSDSDHTKIHATQISEQLGCKMPMINYNSVDSETVHNVLVRTKHDFVLIQDSGEIVNKQDAFNPDSVEEVQNWVRYQLDLARTVVRLKPDTEVFIGSLPPRFDTHIHAQLTDAYNNTLVVESFLEDHITIVSQDGMNSTSKKKLHERFAKDGVTLTKYGNFLMSKNLSRKVTNKVPFLNICPIKKQGSKFKKYSRSQVKSLLEALLV